LLTLRVITVIDIADRTDIYHPRRVWVGSRWWCRRLGRTSR